MRIKFGLFRIECEYLMRINGLMRIQSALKAYCEHSFTVMGVHIFL